MKAPANVLVIDDEQQLRKLLFRLISLEGFNVVEASDLKSASAILKATRFEVILCDVRLPDGNGVDFVSQVKAQYPTTEIILLTAFGNITDGVRAIKNGAFDYLEKGTENSRVIPLLFQAVEKAKQQTAKAVKVNSQQIIQFETIIGTSAPLKSSIQQARKIASTDTTVLLLGETGTGKEVFANAIHQASARNNNPIVAVNCSSFSKELLEGELFGHKAGAYTGANKDKSGIVEMADKGTLFLDEVGEIPLELQAKLLRFLESGEFIKLGDTKLSKVDVRLIAATNRNLRNDVKSGHFREDLYYRLNVFAIELPALRDRKEDIEILAGHFADNLKEGTTLATESLQLLKEYSWPGNIRELRNVLQRAIILSDGQQIFPEHLPAEIQSANNSSSSNFSLADVERNHIARMLEYSNGNKTKAAQLLGIGVATLYRKLDEYKL